MRNLQKKIFRIILKIFSTCMIIFGCLILFGGVYSAVTGTNNFPFIPTLLLLFFFGLCPVVAGIYIFIITSRKNISVARDGILKIAQKYNGKLTAVELALELSISIDKSKEMLDNLASGGFIDSRIGKKGVLVYLFTGFLTENEKNSAKRIEDL